MTKLTVILLLLGIGCKRDIDGRSSIKYYWENKSVNSVEIRPFRNGVLNEEKVILLLPGQKKEVGSAILPDKADLGTCFSSSFLNADSVKVVFNGVFVITHYFLQGIATWGKHYDYGANRNLSSRTGYVGNITRDVKYGRDIAYNYIFSEQDYQDAK